MVITTYYNNNIKTQALKFSIYAVSYNLNMFIFLSFYFDI